MIGLGKTWRLTFRNALAVDIAAGAVVVSGRLVKFSATGAQEFSATDLSIVAGAATVNGAYSSGAEIDNSTDKYLGGDFVVAVIAPAGATGRVDIYYERKVNGLWPTSGNGKLITQIIVAASGTFYQDFSL